MKKIRSIFEIERIFLYNNCMDGEELENELHVGKALLEFVEDAILLLLSALRHEGRAETDIMADIIPRNCADEFFLNHPLAEFLGVCEVRTVFAFCGLRAFHIEIK